MYEIWSVGHKPFENITNNKVYTYSLIQTSWRGRIEAIGIYS